MYELLSRSFRNPEPVALGGGTKEEMQNLLDAALGVYPVLRGTFDIEDAGGATRVTNRETGHWVEFRVNEKERK